MMIAVMLFVLVLLLLLNAFFVLAEFAAVKIRPTQIDELERAGNRRVKALRHVNHHIDEYLSVCQLGITFASIGLGFVGEPAVAKLLVPLLGNTAAAHSVAVSISYIAISFLHILIGELVPKSMALRMTESAALISAGPLRLFHRLFYIPLVLLNSSANLILRLLRMPSNVDDSAPSEVELRMMLSRSQQEGLMPFRRLLLMENVFDFGDGRVKDEMQPMSKVVALYADAPWEENRQKILTTRFSRFPLLAGSPPRPLGVVHLKDLLYQGVPWPDPVDLKSIARKTYLTAPDVTLEQLLTDLRRRRVHMALVKNAQGDICGLITMEDIIEQLVGAIEDEFERDAPLRLGDVLTDRRILLDLESATAETAIAEIIAKLPTEDIGIPKQTIREAVLARERSMSTYLGHGLAVPHARLEGIRNAFVFAARSTTGVKAGEGGTQRAEFFFLVLTPAATPRMQVKLLARIAALRESSFVWDRVQNSATAADMMEAIRSSDEMLTE